MRFAHWGVCLVLAGFVAACSDDSDLSGPTDFDAPTAALTATPFAAGPSGSALAPARALIPATTDCTFTMSGTTMKLDADCTTDATIYIPDGFTLDGKGHTITAVNPPAGNFLRAVIENAGSTAGVEKLTIVGNFSGGCNPSGPVDTRLRGILFEGASGTIEKNTVIGINKGNGCQEGNAIEVRNAPFDGTHPNTVDVSINHNELADWQKTGIVTNGDVSARIEHNDIGPSATQANLAANSIQVGFGAVAQVAHNDVAGNSWHTASAAATGVLVIAAGATADVHHNDVTGNADVGIYFDASDGSIEHNKVNEDGADGFYDYGIGDWGVNNVNRHNDVCGYDIPYDGNPGEKNKVCKKKIN